MSRRLVRLWSCLLLLLALGTSPASFTPTSTALASGSIPTIDPASTPFPTETPTPSPTTAPTLAPSPTPQTPTCTTQTAVWTDDEWGGHYFIYWPANWQTETDNPVRLVGNFKNARYRVFNRQGSNDMIYLWSLTASGYTTVNIPPSDEGVWKTISFDTQNVYFGSDAFLGAKTFSLEFCTTNPPIIPATPGLESCYHTTAVFENDPWEGHYIATWRPGWPYDPQNQRVLLGNYQNARYRVTNYHGINNEPVRLWADTSAGVKGIEVRDEQWHTITSITKSIIFAAHVRMGGRVFDLDICFEVKPSQFDRYDITRTPEGSAAVRTALARWGTAGINTNNMRPEDYEVTSSEVPTGAVDDIQDTLVKPKTFIQQVSYKIINAEPSSDPDYESFVGLIGDTFTITFPSDGALPDEMCTRRMVKNYGVSNQCIKILKQDVPGHNAIAYAIEHWTNGRSEGTNELRSVFSRSRFMSNLTTTNDVRMGTFSPTSDSVDPNNCLPGSVGASIGFGGEVPVNASFSGEINWQICPGFSIDSTSYTKGFAVNWNKPIPLSVVNQTRSAGYMYAGALQNAQLHQLNHDEVGFDTYGAIVVTGIRPAQP